MSRAGLVALLAAALCAWGAGRPAYAEEPSGAEPVRIHFVLSTYVEVERAGFMADVALFNERNPGIDVGVVSGASLVHDTHDAYMRFLALEDPSIDVYRLDIPWIPEFAYPGWLRPLDGLLPPGTRETFLPKALEGGLYQGTLYGLPLEVKGNLLFYRKDLLARHALEPPTTLAELDRQARLLRAAHPELIAGLVLHPDHIYNDVYPMVWASGGAVVRPDGGVVLDSPSNIRVLTAVARLFGDTPDAPVPTALYRGAWTQAHLASRDAFIAGKVPFAIEWSPMWDAIQGANSPLRDKVGTSPIPGVDAGPGSSNNGSWYLVISRFSKHPVEAAKFIAFMTSKEVQLARHQRDGTIPSRVMGDADVAAQFPDIPMIQKALSVTRARPRVPNGREVHEVTQKAFDRIISGEVAAHEALRGAARELRKLSMPAYARPLDSQGLSFDVATHLDWATPLWVAGGGVLVIVVVLLGFFGWHNRRPLRLLSTLRAKLVLVGGATMMVVMVTATGLMTSQAVRSQQSELEASARFFADQLVTHSRTLGQQLSLAASLLAESAKVAGPESSDGEPLSQLMMASHFNADLLFLQLIGRDGQLLHTDMERVVEAGARADRFEPPADTVERVRRRTVTLNRRTEAGVGDYLELFVPVFRYGVHLGAVRLGVSQERYRKALEATQQRHRAETQRLVVFAIGAALALLLLGVLLVTWLAGRMTRPIVALTVNAERIREGDLDVDFAPGPSDEIGTLTTTMAEMVQGLRDRDFIQGVFGRYVTPQLADVLLQDPDSLALGGRSQELTILMSDLRGFTSLSSALGPQRMVSLLNRYLGCMTDVIIAHGGTVNEFIGDAILVLFGAPVEQLDHAVRAVRCAAAMQEAMGAFNATSVAEGIPVLEMGIGISTGVVVAGNIGSELRAKYGVVGPPVNMAGRIESLTVGGQVLLTAETREAAGEVAEVDEPTSVEVKGRAEPLLVYELISVLGEDGERVAVKEAGEGVTCAVDLAARWVRLAGKTVEGEEADGRLTALGAEAAEVEVVSGALSPLDNVKLRLQLPAGRWTTDAYAKVVAASAVEGSGKRSVTLRFTSLAEADRWALQAVVKAASEAG